MALELKLIDPKRSAHASIRGYLYQACLGAKRWLELRENEALLCEGDEDLDRLLLDGSGGLSEQVKALKGDVNVRELRETLRHFLETYVALRRGGEKRRFLFTTTARRRRQRTRDLGVDVLDAWNDPSRRPAVIEAVRKLVVMKGDGDAPEALAWLDGADARWADFFDAVEWRFEAPDLEKIRRQIGRNLAARPETRDLPEENLVDRIVAVVLEGTRQPLPAMRLLTCRDLERFLNGIRVDLATWAASPSAARLRGVFAEIRNLDQLLYDGRRPLPAGEIRPGKLLTAAYEVVPFEEQGRREDLDALAEWCVREAPRSVQLFTGVGGTGKTRLLIEWCQRVKAQGWHAGFLKPGRTAADLRPLFEGLTPRLVVVDYAETRLSEIVEPLLRELALGTTGPKLRLVLLARHAGEWWPALARREPAVEDLLVAAPSVRRLTVLFPDPELRAAAFRRAAEFFTLTLGRRLEDISVPDLSAGGFERTLVLHMAALAAVEGRAVEDSREALKRTLEHERRFWRREAEDLGLDVAQVETLEEAMEVAVAALTLIGGVASRQEAQEVIGAVTVELPLRGDLRRQLIKLLRRLYIGEEGSGRYLEGLTPDLLGEELVAETLTQEASLLPRLLNATRKGHPILTVLTRLAQRRPEADEWLRAAVRGRLPILAVAALDVAVETGDPMGLLIARELEYEKHLEVVEALMRRCDQQALRFSVPLSELAMTATKRVLNARLESWKNPTEDQLGELARLAINLGGRLRVLGRLEDALDATHQAVDDLRRLARRQPEAFLPDLAMSLSNMSMTLNALGRREDALETIREAVDCFGELAKRKPDAFLLEYAMSLNNLGTILRVLGRREEALAATQESADHLRRLAQRSPNAFLHELAMSLSNLGTMLSDLGRRNDALDITQEAVNVRRQLARARPDAFLADLASSLRNLGTMLRALGLRDDALDATRESVDLYRQLARTRPKTFIPELAMSLNNLGLMLGDLGQREAALKATQEAVDLYRQLAESRPDAFLSLLAASLNNLGLRLHDLGNHEDALGVTHNAVDIRRELAQKDPEAFQPSLAESLNNLGSILSVFGRREDALNVTQEAVGIRRGLALASPDTFFPYLAESLNNLGNRHSELNQIEYALEATQEAVNIRRELAQKDPDAFQPSLASCLNNLGNRLGELGRREAVDVTQESVDLYRKLAQASPAAFLPGLASSLTNLGIRLRDLGRRENALEATQEAAQSLAPFFVRNPAAFAIQMRTMLLNYLQRAEEAGQQPDADLVKLIGDAFETLRPEAPPG